jgi:hypothetical protein
LYQCKSDVANTAGAKPPAWADCNASFRHQAATKLQVINATVSEPRRQFAPYVHACMRVQRTANSEQLTEQAMRKQVIANSIAAGHDDHHSFTAEVIYLAIG